MKCKICKSDSKYLFSSKMLNKYDVKYFKCPNCEFIQTEKPYWLDEAYQHAITDLDIGLVYRNLDYSKKIYQVITNSFNYKNEFLDYAGGYGLFVRIMRDKGLNFYHHDKFCENIFATNHELSSLKIENKFEAITALEVFEHLEDPIEEIKNMTALADNIIFSTELVPNNIISKPDDWWYFVPETGQHIAFYSKKNLEYIAKLLNLHYYNQENLHIFSSKKFTKNPFTKSQKEINIPSLLNQDFLLAKSLSTTHKANSATKKYSKKSNNKQYIDNLIKLFNQLKSLKISVKLLKSDNSNLETKNKIINSKLNKTIYKLHEIYDSQGWRILRHIYQIRDKIIPEDGKLKSTIKAIITQIKLINLNKPRYSKRKINLKSNKIVYIGHSYHAKTKSTEFLLDYLKENFEVTELLDDSWQGKPFPDISFIDDSYLGIIFFQNLPNPEIYNTIKNKNLIFFPMYDSHGGLSLDYWKKYSNLKIINFSKTLHNKLFNWGFESIYLQYFPKPLPFIRSKENKVFFWQRIDKIDIDLVEKLIGKFKTKIHIHKSIDPNYKFKDPTKQQEKKFQISYSDWFKTRNKMQAKIQECNIYIAPREYEGIGLSFLEAMAMGKVVIAPNNPTMNEYIINNKTGYLYNINSPKQIGFLNILEIQKNTIHLITNGYKRWVNQKHNIIKFIKKND